MRLHVLKLKLDVKRKSAFETRSKVSRVTCFAQRNCWSWAILQLTYSKKATVGHNKSHNAAAKDQSFG